MATVQAKPRPTASAVMDAVTARVVSLDAFRGFTMVCMISNGFGLLAFGGPLANQFRHAEWDGMNFWDLIQPFFMFIVGTVMPLSFARRWAAGETWSQSLWHVLRRCALLILCGLIARSIQANRPVIDLINVLAQISFTYLVAFLLLRASWPVQGAAALGLLALHTGLSLLVPDPWTRDVNLGAQIDRAVLGKNWGGGYATMNCLSSAANTIFGVMAGRLLLSGKPPAAILRVLLATGLGGILAGLALSGWIPIIKKIWTASFALYSVGFTLLALLLFYWICDVQRRQRWAAIFLIVGANSIFIYLFHEILGRWMNQSGLVFTKWAVDLWGPWGQLLHAWLVIGFQIYVCVWLYRRRIFFKL